jgi:hypothetical protein
VDPREIIKQINALTELLVKVSSGRYTGPLLDRSTARAGRSESVVDSEVEEKLAVTAVESGPQQEQAVVSLSPRSPRVTGTREHAVEPKSKQRQKRRDPPAKNTPSPVAKTARTPVPRRPPTPKTTASGTAVPKPQLRDLELQKKVKKIGGVVVVEDRENKYHQWRALYADERERQWAPALQDHPDCNLWLAPWNDLQKDMECVKCLRKTRRNDAEDEDIRSWECDCDYGFAVCCKCLPVVLRTPERED